MPVLASIWGAFFSVTFKLPFHALPLLSPHPASFRSFTPSASSRSHSISPSQCLWGQESCMKSAWTHCFELTCFDLSSSSRDVKPNGASPGLSLTSRPMAKFWIVWRRIPTSSTTTCHRRQSLKDWRNVWRNLSQKCETQTLNWGCQPTSFGLSGMKHATAWTVALVTTRQVLAISQYRGGVHVGWTVPQVIRSEDPKQETLQETLESFRIQFHI